MLKLHIFVRLRIATENSSHALSPLQKKSNARASNLLFQSTFEFSISHKQWLQRGGVTPHHTAPMPRCSDRRQHFGHRLIGDRTKSQMILSQKTKSQKRKVKCKKSKRIKVNWQEVKTDKSQNDKKSKAKSQNNKKSMKQKVKNAKGQK